ncbi:MAG: E3 binding domain-containing protein, partial [Verrucomicrobiota bacterium]|nr:E3 binding domain-containing protein [Verrucomicrobiota bacterium]
MAQIIDMPKLSDTMTVGKLVKWLKKEGDPVKNGDMLAEVETDKATMELESFFDGTLLKIFAPAGSQIAIGAPLAAIGQPGETVETPAAPPPKAPAKSAPKADSSAEASAKVEATPQAAGAPAKPAPSAPAKKPTPPATPAHSATTPARPAPAKAPSISSRVRISPLAKKLAAEKSVEYSLLSGSGPGGRIVRADVLAAEKSPPQRLHSGPVQDETVE